MKKMSKDWKEFYGFTDENADKTSDNFEEQNSDEATENPDEAVNANDEAENNTEYSSAASDYSSPVNNDLFRKLQKLIANKFEIDENKIKMNSTLRGDAALGADSLDLYELVYAIEEEFNVSIPDEKTSKFETVEDIYDFIVNNKK